MHNSKYFPLYFQENYFRDSLFILMLYNIARTGTCLLTPCIHKSPKQSAGNGHSDTSSSITGYISESHELSSLVLSGYSKI